MPAVTNDITDLVQIETEYLHDLNHKHVDSCEIKWIVDKVRGEISNTAYQQKRQDKQKYTNQLEPLILAYISRGHEPIYVRPPTLNYDRENRFSAYGRRLDYTIEHEKYFFGRNRYHDPYLIRGEMNPDIAKQLVSRCLKSALQHYQKTNQGKYEIKDQEVTINLERRRPSNISVTKISEALLYGQFASDERSLVYLMADFYLRHVEPHLTTTASASPLAWAKATMEIVHGYGVTIGSSDYIPRSSEIAYEQVAKTVGNLVPSTYKLNRTYQISPELKQTIATITSSSFPIQPEVIALACEHQAAVFNGALLDPEVERFLSNAKYIFDNGFLIERFSEYCQALEKSGFSPQDSFVHTASVVDAIYSIQNKPWWFKEDFSLTRGLEAGLSLPEIEAIASKHTHHFSEIINSLLVCPKELLAQVPLENNEKINLISEICVNFGTGTPERVKNILEYAAHLFAEVPISEISLTKDEFLTYLSSRHPSSIIHSMLEGDLVNFKKPGIVQMLLARFGEAYLTENRIDAQTIKAKAISELAPLLIDHKTRQELPLLIPGRPAGAVQLITEIRNIGSANTSQILAHPDKILSATAPLRYLCRFNNQLNIECTYPEEDDPERIIKMKDELARIYFIFIANKLPDPLAPPVGFLTFLSKFKETPLESIKFSFAIEEDEIERNHLNNQEARIGKYAVITTLLDLYNFKLISAHDLSKICNWLIADISDELVKTITEVHSYKSHLESKRDRAWENEMYCLQEHTFSLRKNLAEADKNKRRKDVRVFLSGEQPASQDASSVQDYWTRLEKLGEETRYQDIKRDVDYENRQTFDYYMEPEQRRHFEEDPDESLRESIRRDINTANTKLRQHRLRHLQDFFQACSLHSSLLGLGIITREEACSKVHLELKDILLQQDFHPKERQNILAGKLEHYCDYDEVESTSNSRAIISANIFHMIKDGIFVKERIRENFLAVENLEQLVEFQRTLNTAQDAFRSSQTKVIQFFNLLTVSRYTGREPQMQAEAKCTIGEFANIPLEYPIISRTAVEEKIIFYAKSFPNISISKRLDVATQIISGQQTLTTACSMLERELHSTNQRLLFTWGAAVTSQAIIDQLELLRETSLRPVGPNSNLNFVEGLMQLTDLLPLAEETFTPELIAEFKDQIIGYRRESFGLHSVGAKIHFLNPVDEQQLDIYIQKLNLDQSSFRLIHAGTSLIIKPMATAEELELIIYFLNSEGLLDLEYPEIQITAPGRLPLEDAAFLGSFTILSSDLGVRYSADSFKTNAHDNDVGFRIMTYDAGARLNPMLFVDSSISGRTDILGRRSTKDIANYQLISTILVQGHAGKGIFQELCEPFKRDWQATLEAHGLEDVLKTDWLWTRETRPKSGSAEKHYQEAIQPCTDAWFNCVEEAERDQSDSVGIVKATEILLDSYRNKARILSQQALQDPSYKRERELLLNL